VSAPDPVGELFRPERVRRPREQVEFQIRSAILSGHFREGDRLPREAELAKRFVVSRSTVREALRALAAAGLIATSPGAGGGSYVKGVDHRSLAAEFGESVGNILQLGTLSHDEVAEVRAMLEVPAARLAARNRRPEHLEELGRILQGEREAEHDDPVVDTLNSAFHRIVAEASGNRMLEALVTALHEVTHPLSFIRTTPELGRQAVKEHRAIIRAIGDGDEELAARTMEDHLRLLGEHAARAAAATT
jgi:DNA-binding FadR family transcriptional regulator